jgi:hypothetical protein
LFFEVGEDAVRQIDIFTKGVKSDSGNSVRESIERDKIVDSNIQVWVVIEIVDVGK